LLQLSLRNGIDKGKEIDNAKRCNQIGLASHRYFTPGSCVPAFAGSANDPVSGLPLAPGMTPSNDPLSITICGKPAQVNQYMARNDMVAADIAWYKAHLPGYHMVHAFWSDRSQDTFFSPDGMKGVTITGTPKSDRVFSVTYLSLKTGLTEHQWMVFSVQSIVQGRSASFSNFLE